MLALLCLCCSHRNPADASFCNACGTPLHLKPCTRCDTINQRAAAHCRNCGEAFAFDFSAADDDDQPGVDGTVTLPEQAREVAPSGTPGASQLRASALLVVLIGAAGFSAFYALRDPPRSFEGVNGARPGSAYLPVVSAAPVAALASERPAAGGTLPDVNGPPTVVADAGAGAALAKPSPQARTKPPGATKSLAAARKPRLAQKAARSHARGPASPAVASNTGGANASSACAEGGVLSETCDVRMLAKGN